MKLDFGSDLDHDPAWQKFAPSECLEYDDCL